MARLTDLPDELLLQIFRNLRYRIWDLRSGSLVCRKVSGAATEVLYRRTPEHTDRTGRKCDPWVRRYERFAFSVANDPQLSRHVRHLNLEYLSCRGPVLQDIEVANFARLARLRLRSADLSTTTPQSRPVSVRRDRRHRDVSTAFTKEEMSKLQSIKRLFPSEARSRMLNDGVLYLLLFHAIGVKCISIGAFRLSSSTHSDSSLLLKLLAAESITDGPTGRPLLPNLTSVAIGYSFSAFRYPGIWSTAAISTFMKLPAVRTLIALNLTREPLLAEAWKCPPQASNVTTIELKGCAVTADTVRNILGSCKSLEMFSCSTPFSIHGRISGDVDRLQTELSRLHKTLRFLRLELDCPADGQRGLDLSGMTVLEDVVANASLLPGYNNADLVDISKHLPLQLKVLDLTFYDGEASWATDKLTEIMILKIATSCRLLPFLQVRIGHQWEISPDALDKLRRKIPGIEFNRTTFISDWCYWLHCQRSDRVVVETAEEEFRSRVDKARTPDWY